MYFNQHNTVTLLFELLLLLAGIPVEGKSSMCLICINNYSILILITGILSLSAWVKYCYRILQTHHARTRAHTRAHACAHTCTNVHKRAHTCTHTAFAAVAASPPYMLSLFGGAQPTVAASPLATMPVAGHSNQNTNWRPDLPEVLEVFRV